MNKAIFRLISFSLLGITVFFIPISISGKSTIALDHLVSFLINNLKPLSYAITVIFLVVGGILPLVRQDWRKGPVDAVLVALKLIAIPIGAMYFLGMGPDLIMAPNMVPFLFEKLVMPVGLIVPLGAIFLSLLVGYGLLEFIGVLLEPVMRPIWKTPGRSAIDSVASFTGSYSIGLLITNRVYNEGKYSVREASIIATGFSTVSAAFMLVVAKTLNLMDIWNFFFWSTLLITFTVTAATLRLKPLSSMDDQATAPLDILHNDKSILKHAFEEGMATARSAPSLTQNILTNFVDGLKMSISIVPAILSVGLAGLLLAEHTLVFDWIGYLLYPFAALAQIPEAMLASKAIATGFAEMFLPSLYSVDASLETRYVVAVTSISSILFLSGSIPCILSTDIPISVGKLAIIWLQRAILSMLLAALFSQFIT